MEIAIAISILAAIVAAGIESWAAASVLLAVAWACLLWQALR